MNRGASPGYVEQWLDHWGDTQWWLNFWSPAISLPFGLNPAATLGTLFALMITTGIAVGALATLLLSLLALYLLLTQVFGFRFEFALP